MSQLETFQPDLTHCLACGASAIVKFEKIDQSTAEVFKKKAIAPNSLANLTYHKGRSPLPYKPIRLQVPLDPALVDRIDKYKGENIKTKNGRNRAIAQLIEIGLSIVSRPDI